MAKNINQLTTAATSILATDKMYLGRSPFGVTDDRYILGSSIIAQLAPLTTKGDIYTFTTVNARLAVATGDGKFLQVSSAAATGLAWSTATIPSTATGTGTILRADGTNWVATTATYPATTTVNQLLYSSSANVIAGLTTANNGALVTSSAGVPSILVGPGTTGNFLQSNAAAAPSWSASTIVLGGNFTMSGAFTFTGTLTNTTSVTFPTSGTLATTSQIPTGAALTKADDTNVTLTLGGSPTTALVNAASITAGWTGQLGLTRGGTAASLTASNGGIVYSTASALAVFGGTATAGLALLSGASTTPSWSTSPPITQVNVQKFTGSGTYTPTTGMKYCLIECQGAGGGGGGCAATGNCAGGGGGSGGYIKVLCTAAQIGASQTVTIGAAGTAGTAGNNAGGTGGTTSVGTLFSSNGGGGGSGNAGSASATFGVAGGAGGSVSLTTGTYLKSIGGGAGFPGCNAGATYVGWSPSGANSQMGWGGVVGTTVAVTGVDAPANSGAGGSGGFGTGGTKAGGAGGSGFVCITEFISV